MGIRIVAVLLCSALSSYGIVMSSMQAMSNPFAMVLVPYAWLAYFVFCAAWIGQMKLSRFWMISGTVAGVGSLAMEPFGFLLVFPSVLLAAHIIMAYHFRSDSPNNRAADI
jgi:hypothetical protein